LCFTRLNFGISSAAEIFQNVVCEILDDSSGMINISDDILVFGKIQEHNQNIRAVFQRIKEKGLTHYEKKHEFSKDRL